MTAYPVAERRKRRVAAKAKKRAKPAPSLTPHRCVVIAVDPGESSGFAVFLRGVCMTSGEVHASDIKHISGIIEWARHLAADRGLPLVLVRERPFGGRMGTNSSGASRVWKACWDSAGVVKSRSVTVYPSTWRAKVLGRGWGNAPRDKVRPEEQRVARVIKHDPTASVGTDESAAVCIGRWAVYASEVAAKLPKGRKP